MNDDAKKVRDSLQAALPRLKDEMLEMPLEVLVNDLRGNPIVGLLLLLAKTSGAGPKAEVSAMVDVLKTHPMFPQVMLAAEGIHRGREIEALKARVNDLEHELATRLAETLPPIDIG